MGPVGVDPTPCFILKKAKAQKGAEFLSELHFILFHFIFLNVGFCSFQVVGWAESVLEVYF